MEQPIPGPDAGRTIFHIDMDAFYASIEQRDHPAYAGKPVIVGAAPGTRGVVCAASYEARRFGVRSAMPISEAYRRCPQGVYVRPRGEAYERESARAMAIIGDFSPVVEQISIDEAFVDLTGTRRLQGEPEAVARSLKARIRAELLLTASVGIAPNKLLAKIASDIDKPDGLTVAPFDRDGIAAWLAPMPVGRIWGVGKKTEALLHGAGIRTVGDMQRVTRRELERRFGGEGGSLYELCRGIDERPVGAAGEQKSVSREHTFERDETDRGRVRAVLLGLCDDVARRCRQNGLKGTTVVLIYRSVDFTKHTIRTTLPLDTDVSQELYRHACTLLERVPATAGKFRLIGVGLTGFDGAGQTDLFESAGVHSPWKASDRAMDKIRERFGDKAIRRAGEGTAGNGKAP